jgi:hypothetical protein
VITGTIIRKPIKDHMASVSKKCRRLILRQISCVLLGSSLFLSQSSLAAVPICFDAQNSVHDLISKLEVLEVSDRHLQDLTDRFFKMRDEHIQPRQSSGILTSNRAGKYWGEIVLNEELVLKLGGTPRLIRGRFWLPVLIERERPEIENADENDAPQLPPPPKIYRYVSMDSLFRVYGKKFFTEKIEANAQYLAPVGSLQRHVYELVSIVKTEGEQLLIRNKAGVIRRISKQEFFSANVSILHWPGFQISLSIGKMRDFFQSGGEGDIFLSELTTSPQQGTEIAFEGFYIRIKKMPRYHSNLFSNEKAHRVFAENMGRVPLVYTFSGYFSGVNIPKDAPGSVNMTNRLKMNKRMGFIGITDRTDAETFVHEKRHYDDDNSNPALHSFLSEISGLVKTGRLPINANLVFHHALYEQRAYGAEVAVRKQGRGISENSDEKIEERIEKVKSDFSAVYLEPLMNIIESVSQEDPVLANWLKSEVKENAWPSDEVTFPF